MSLPPLPPPPPEPDDGRRAPTPPPTPPGSPPDLPAAAPPDPYQPAPWTDWANAPGLPASPTGESPAYPPVPPPGVGYPGAPSYPAPGPTDTGPSRLAGVGAGCGGMLLILLVLGVIGNQGWGGPVTGLVSLLPLGLLVAGIVFTAQERTRRFGTGMLISIGVAVLIAGGSCLALIAMFANQ